MDFPLNPTGSVSTGRRPDVSGIHNNFFPFSQFSLYDPAKMVYNGSDSSTEGGAAVNCLKCGRMVPENQVFCDACREEMANYPVKPDTPVLLPIRSQPAAAKRPQKRRTPRKPEEQILRLKRAVRRLVAVICVLVLLMGIGSAAVLGYIKRRKAPAIGQNYSTVQTTTTP